MGEHQGKQQRLRNGHKWLIMKKFQRVLLIGLMQKFDPILVQKKEFCLNDREQFKTMFEDIDLNMQIGGKYPVLMKIVALKRH